MPKDFRVRGDKRARIYHRLVTGLQLCRNQGGYVRFMTLTTARSSKMPMKEAFAVLRKRILRATLEKGGFVGFKLNRYYCLKTSEGNGVMHIVFWTSSRVTGYIPQRWLSRNWLEIYGASIVDIRKCYFKGGESRSLANYLISNYLQRQPIKRMSYGHRWAWLGFCKSWKNVKSVYGLMKHTPHSWHRTIPYKFSDAYCSQSVGAWRGVLHEPPITSHQYKLKSEGISYR